MPSNYAAIHLEQSTRLASYLGVPLREDTAYKNHEGVEKDGVRKRCRILHHFPLEAIVKPVSGSLDSMDYNHQKGVLQQLLATMRGVRPVKVRAPWEDSGTRSFRGPELIAQMLLRSIPASLWE